MLCSENEDEVNQYFNDRKLAEIEYWGYVNVDHTQPNNDDETEENKE